MGRIGIPKTREAKRTRRHLRVRKSVTGTPERPRLVVFRSLKHIYAQLVDDVSGKTLLTVSDSKFEGKKREKSAGSSRAARRKRESRASSSIAPGTSTMAA